MQTSAEQNVNTTSAVTPGQNPFVLENHQAYANWRAHKLAQYPQQADELLVPVNDPRALSAAESAAIRQVCARANMAIYVTRSSATGELADTSLVADMGRQFGLQRLDQNLYADDDGISALQVSAQRRQYEYIPYSRRAISWHTDGYYNPPSRKVCAMMLHCVRPAVTGGENTLLDHEMIYLQLRDKNPDYIAALMQDDAMIIPANIEEGVEIRPEQGGPVFSVTGSVDAHSGQLHMRYTARTRSIVWKADATTQAAVKCLEQLLLDSPYRFKRRLTAGEGLICNNVLHTRTAFDDADADDESQGRLMYRARYYDRIQ